MRKRFFQILVGKPQSGKSYYANKFIQKYNSLGGFSLVYNHGRSTDFKDHVEYEIPDIYDLASRIKDKKKRSYFINRPFLPYFIDNKGGIAPFIQRAGGKIKIGRTASRQMENAFWRYMFAYMYNTLLTIDDARPVFRYGLNEDMTNVFSRINHPGKKAGAKQPGIDVQILFQDFEMINPDLFSCATHIRMFKVNFLPPKIGSLDLTRVVYDCKKRLDELPDHSSFLIEIETLNVKLNTP